MINYSGPILMKLSQIKLANAYYGYYGSSFNEPAIDALVAITKYYVDKYSAQNRMDMVYKTVAKLRDLSIKVNIPIYVNMKKKYFIEMKGE